MWPRVGDVWGTLIFSLCFDSSLVMMKFLFEGSAGSGFSDLAWHLYCPRVQLSSCLTRCDPMDPRPPCPSPSPRACSNSCPLSQWCHPTVLSSVIPFSSCLQSFPASGSSQMSQFFMSGGQSIGVSTLASVLPVNIQDWFHLGLTDWISLQSKGFSRVFSNTTVQKHQFFSAQPSLWSNCHIRTALLNKP